MCVMEAEDKLKNKYEDNNPSYLQYSGSIFGPFLVLLFLLYSVS